MKPVKVRNRLGSCLFCDICVFWLPVGLAEQVWRGWNHIWWLQLWRLRFSKHTYKGTGVDNLSVSLKLKKKFSSSKKCFQYSFMLTLSWTMMMTSLCGVMGIYACNCAKNAILMNRRVFSLTRDLRAHAEKPDELKIDIPPTYDGKLFKFRFFYRVNNSRAFPGTTDSA